LTRVLVVTPAFHGYGDSIGNALRRRGHDVTVHPYDAHVGAWEKARYKLTVELPGQLGVDRMASAARRATGDALEALDVSRPDVVLVIRGDRWRRGSGTGSTSGAGPTSSGCTTRCAG
jgi:spore maturation protein CgeB